MRLAHIAALLALSCGNASEDCGRPIDNPAGPGCLYLTSEQALFSTDVGSCGETCLKVRQGTPVYVSGDEEWSAVAGNCSELPHCP